MATAQQVDEADISPLRGLVQLIARALGSDGIARAAEDSVPMAVEGFASFWVGLFRAWSPAVTCAGSSTDNRAGC